LIALILGVIGIITFRSERGQIMLLAAMALGSLGGLDVSIREHFAGRRSHTTILAGAVAVATMLAVAVVLALAVGGTVIGYTAAVVLGVVAFAVAFMAFRESFRKRSGGLSYR
jgi:hypothetical protein